MDINLKKINLKNDLFVYSPDGALSLVKEIWEDEIYTKEYPVLEGDKVIDIGANIGIFSLFAASRGAKVYAFEPNPTTFGILKKNVDENRLNEMITIFNCAVSTFDGELELQLPVSNQIYALGSATISDKLKNEMSRKMGLQFKPVLTEAVSINTILKKYFNSSSKINLLKIDCEGAEFEIFSNLDKNNADKILNIAMETHDGYSEKAIVSLLNQKGYIIDKYVKRTGHYKTGYCYARHINNSVNRKTEKKAIAIINGPSTAICNEKISFDGTDSFILNDAELKMKFSWEIDGILVDNHNNIFESSFSTSGAHLIKCKISNGSETDFETKKVITFKKHHEEINSLIGLGAIGEKIIVPVEDVAFFCIKKEHFPKMWDFDKIAVSIDVLDQTFEFTKPIELESNGSVYSLKESYNVIEIETISNEYDIVFSLKNLHSKMVEVTWWLKNDINEIVIMDTMNENCSIILNPRSVDLQCTIDKLSYLVIKKDYYPTDWTPRCIKVGIAALPMGDIHQELDGTLMYNDTNYKLLDWYTEVEVTDVNTNFNITFTIQFKEKRNIKIAWWAE